ncbi:MAG: hypothetical protein GWO04_39005, partial [Actinobacteria bacterium]|nr:hypothetical protein [Actinomycetota bacterium]
GWLFVIHERLSYPGTTRFAHRFVLVDDDLTLAGVGPRFSLTGAPIEFVAGLATLDDELVLSFGVA